MLLSSRIFKRPTVLGIYCYQPATARTEEKETEPENSIPAATETIEENMLFREKIETSTSQGYQDGKREAETHYRELLEATSRRLAQLEESARSCLQQAKQRAREILDASEPDLVRLSTAIAEKLINNQLEAAPHTIAWIVRESIRSLPVEEPVEVHVNPEDLPACISELGQAGQSNCLNITEYLPEARLSRGSCRVESASGTVEYFLDEELEKIKEALLEMVPAEKDTESRGAEAAYGKH